MSDSTTSTVTLPIEDLGSRMILCEQIAEGTTAEGREFFVGRSIGGLSIMVTVDGGGRYLIPLKGAVEHVLALDSERWEAGLTARAEGRAS